MSIAAIALVAVAIRFLHAFATTYRPVSDMAAYLDYSKLLGHGSPDTIYTTLFPPGYTWFLWALQKLREIDTPLPVSVSQAFLSGSTVLMVAGIARWFYGARAAIIGASLFCLYKSSIHFTGVVLSETLAEFFLVASLLLFLKYVDHGRLWILILCAAATSLAVHTRVNLIVAPILIALALSWLMYKRGQGMLRILAHAAVYVAVVVLSLVPWGLRNSRLHGHPTFISTNGGLNLLQGNNGDTEGGWYRIEDITEAGISEIQAAPFKDRAYLYKKAATDFILSHLAYEAFFLVPQRFKYTFLGEQTSWPWDLALDSNYATHPFGPWVRIPLVPFSAVFVLGLAGFCIPGRNKLRFLLPLLWVGLLPPILMVPGNPRYHYVFDFLLIIAAGAIIGRAIPCSKFRFVVRGAWITVVSISLLSSLLQYLRLGGQSLLRPHRAMVLSQFAKDAVLTTATAGAAGKTVVSNPLPLFEASVNPNTTSHLLLSADISYMTSNLSFVTPNIRAVFYDSKGSMVEKPKHGTELLPQNVFLNPNVGFESVWRVLLVPASAVRIQLDYLHAPAGTVQVKNLKLTGPVWD